MSVGLGSSPAASGDVLRSRVCPRCQYSLEMLPSAGVCPECGRAYDPETIYLYGYATGVKKTAFSSRPSPLYHLVPGALIILTFVILDRSWAAVWFVAMFGFELVVGFWRYFADEGPGAVQLRLGPDGFRQVTRRPGPTPFAHAEGKESIPWRKAVVVELTSVAAERARVRIMSDNTWWKYQSTYVDAEVAASAGQVEALRARLRTWAGVA